jgi:hypothetical protein
MNKFVGNRPYSDPEAAARKLVDIASTVEGRRDAPPASNPNDIDHPPRPPAGSRVEFDKKGWQHRRGLGARI